MTYVKEVLFLSRNYIISQSSINVYTQVQCQSTYKMSYKKKYKMNRFLEPMNLAVDAAAEALLDGNLKVLVVLLYTGNYLYIFLVLT